LAVRVHRNHFGRQIESFEADLTLPFLSDASQAPQPTTRFPGVFIRAPVVEEILTPAAGATIAEDQEQPRPAVEVLAKLPGRVDKMRPGLSQASTKDDSGDIIAVRQGNILGTSFHPELTKDARIHVWWLQQVFEARDAVTS
jgi:5'-phosphate synthase pdxT subunit